MEAGQEAQVSEAQIAVHWREEEYFYPPARFIGQANAADPAIFERFSEEHFPECFKEYADLLTWDAYWHTTLDTSNPPFWKWFVGGRLNACFNCVDRHLASSRNKAALIWVPEPETEETRAITYQELYRRVNEFAALLRDFCGVKVGDRVTFHLPMVPELPVSMLACARLGVIHSEVFGGFSGAACGDRIADSESRILVTMDAYYRNGELIDHKAKADEAVAAARARGSRSTRCWSGGGTRASTDRRVRWSTAATSSSTKRCRTTATRWSSPSRCLPRHRCSSCTRAARRPSRRAASTAPAATSPTSPAPRSTTRTSIRRTRTGASPTSAGSPATPTSSTGRWRSGRRASCTRACPTYPDPGRPWRIAERLGVNIFHTAPTTIRMLRKLGPDEPKKYDYHFKHMTTVGEPIEPDVWRWYHDVVGKGEAVIVDTWWQTENGGFLGSTLPALQPMKPGSCGPGVLGVYPVIYDEDGNVVEAGSGKAGNICIRNPWPGIFQTIWGQPERFVEIYYEKYCRDKESTDWRDWPYFAGDGAVQAADGYFRILGRVDDVINVAGHRLGTKELESASITVEEVAEAAAVPVMDELRGRAVEMYVSLKPGFSPSTEIEEKVGKAIEVRSARSRARRTSGSSPTCPRRAPARSCAG